MREELKKKQAKEARLQADMDGYLEGRAVQFVGGRKVDRAAQNIRLDYGIGKKNPNAQTKPRHGKKKKRKEFH